MDYMLRNQVLVILTSADSGVGEAAVLHE
jgi:hypothetical protein